MLDLPYSSEVVKPLQVLFSQDDLTKLNDIKLVDNTDLNLIVSGMRAEATAAGLPEASLEEAFSSISSFMTDHDNLPRIRTIEFASKHLASSIEHNFHSFTNDIGKVVADLREKITTKFNTLMIRDQVEDFLSGNVTPAESDYTFLKWDGLLTPSYQQEVIETACINANVAHPGLSALNLSYITNKMNFKADFTDVKITDTTHKMMTDVFTVAFASDDSITEDHITDFISMIIDVNKYHQFCGVKAQFTDHKKTAETCCRLCPQMVAFNKLAESAIRLLDGSLSVDTQEGLKSNISVLSKSLTVVQYWLLFTKEITLAKSLILTNTIINEPTYKEFVQEGNSLQGIHNYIKAVHYVNPVPTTGVSLNAVISTKDNISEKLLKAAAANTQRGNLLKAKHLVSAYSLVMDAYVSKLHTSGDELPPSASVDHMLNCAKASSSILAGKLGNIDTVLYKVLFETVYNNPAMKKMYSYLNKSFETMVADTNETITDEHVTMAQCDATIDMLVDHLFDTVVDTDVA